MVKVTKKQGEKYRRYADWIKIEREVRRYINEDSNSFRVDVGGFTVLFSGEDAETKPLSLSEALDRGRKENKEDCTW